MDECQPLVGGGAVRGGGGAGTGGGRGGVRPDHVGGSGLHSSTIRLNLSTLYEICCGLSGFRREKWLRLS